MGQKSCDEKYKNFTHLDGLLYCNAIFDEFLCWPPTIAGMSTNQSCPRFNISQVATRTCLSNGTWQSSKLSRDHSKGYTNYNNCLPVYSKNLMETCQKIEGCFEIIYRTRIIELVGLSLSVFSLIASLFIFYRYRILRNNRTKIHKNLFIATTIQMTIRLLLYVDQSSANWVIENTEYLCKGTVVLLEYAKTAMFMWMFIEGLYLHNVITVTVFQEYSYVKLYLYTGWGIPLVMVMIWVLVMMFTAVNSGCWQFRNVLVQYWILEGPRYTVIIINMIFLLNIIRVLILKLRQSRTSEIEQVRKAVRAALFLLPLLGIAHISFIVNFESFQVAWKFALWSYVTHFFTTFQGFFVALLYCFLNEEVRTAISNSVSVYRFLRTRRNVQTRNSVLDTGMTTFGDSDA